MAGKKAAILWGKPRVGFVSASSLASCSADRRSAAGFIKREIDASDLRRHRLLVTASGRKVMGKGLALLSEAFGSRLSRLSLAQQAELKSLLEKLS